MPRLLHHHDRILARANGRDLRRLLDGAVPADGREGALDGGMLVQAEVELVWGVWERGGWCVYVMHAEIKDGIDPLVCG